MFCYITENWRGRPLVRREVMVNLIGHTTTKEGLAIRSELDEASYPTGRAVSKEQMEKLYIRRDKVHGEWNYTLLLLPSRISRRLWMQSRRFFGTYVEIRPP